MSDFETDLIAFHNERDAQLDQGELDAHMSELEELAFVCDELEDLADGRLERSARW